ncbi:YcxB family protein [Gorillibacterium sp. sgz500922]|uniref:YcxB family protein n=1 Tax=Gorillibacterium sp. sgz500922 TaxID=3446694 RepID=UPI003F67BC27
MIPPVTEIRTKLNREELKAFTKHSLWTKRSQKSYLIMVLISLFCLVGAFMGEYRLLAAPLIFLIFFGAIYFKFVRGADKKPFQEISNFYRLEPEQFFNEASAAGKQSTVAFRWEQVHRIDETPTHFYVYQHTNAAHVLPKRDFPDGTAALWSDYLSTQLKGKYDRFGVRKK